MAKILTYFRLRNLTLLQSIILFTTAYLAIVLTAIGFEFGAIERVRGRMADQAASTGWVLTAQILAILLTVGIGLVAMASLFYRLKLKRPLAILMNASEKISANDLDFRVNYEGRDEMGEICRAFEQMRGQLEVNFRALWRSVEERNRLNAVFAHDLRTPLSVLKGYLEMVSAYWPQRRMSEEKLLDTIRTMENHVERLERYVDAMNSIPKLEDRPVNRIAIESDALIASLTETVRRIAERRKVSVNSHSAADATVLSVDMDLVTQAVENVAANAVRFAVRQIRVDIRVADGTLSVAVADDGPGFSPEELSQAASPFYRGVASASNEHQGLGLYICQALCEKHGGRLRLRNGARGGGEVVAVFDCR